VNYSDREMIWMLWVAMMVAYAQVLYLLNRVQELGGAKAPQQVDSAAAGAWVARYNEWGNKVYEYHVSGHFMDGFREGAAWKAQQVTSHE